MGTAISETLAELGANLVLASRDQAKCEKKCEEIVQLTGGSIKAVALELDVLKKGSAAEFFAQVHEHFEAIDILVNNAWSGNKNSWESITDEDWEYDINMSLNSVFRMTKAAFPDLKATRGVILNIGSMYGHLGPDYRMYDGKEFANPPSYGAAKAGVIQFTKYLASFLVAPWHSRERPQSRRVSTSADSRARGIHATACLQESDEPHWPTRRTEGGGCVALLRCRELHHRTRPRVDGGWASLVKSFGIIGVSEGNGHPFSYGSIINGYSPGRTGGIRMAGHLRICSATACVGIWTGGLDDHARMDSGSGIHEEVVCCLSHSPRRSDYREFLGKVDAVIIARDDYETHFEMAQPFLEAGLPVFVDKPLSLEVSELRAFKPYLEKWSADVLFRHALLPRIG